jgi:hypothetical protein
MNTFDVRKPDGVYRFALHPLSAYEADGGIYTDGQDIDGIAVDDDGHPLDLDAARSEYVAAISVLSSPDEAAVDVESDAIRDVAGVPSHALWRDAATGWYLIRDWPAEAPLDARP